MLVSTGISHAAVYAEDQDTTATPGLCVHHTEHTGECGYTAPEEGSPCTHEHDETCGYVEGSAEVPCDKGCTDTDGDGVIDHAADCAWQPAVEPQPCTHEHDDTCGYVEAGEGTPCTYAENGCPYCITDWSWVDPDGLLVEMDGSWGMGMPGVSAANPLTREALQSMLPTQINATADNGDSLTLDLTWDLTALPEDGATSGNYTVSATLADTGYSLTDAAAPLTVALQLGMTTGDATEEGAGDADADTDGETADDSGVALYTALPSGDPPYPNRIVNGVSPNGTTIDLFDYWIITQTAKDNSNGENEVFLNSGINKDHALLFGRSMEGYTSGQNKTLGLWNCWTADQNNQHGERPRTGIVQNELDDDGYPVLNSAVVDTSNRYLLEDLRGRDGSASLNYLFDPSLQIGGKASYPDVQGLLQVDKDGYYYYNSQENYAVYYQGTNSFTLYDLPGIIPGGLSPVGQFFPFNAATSNGGQFSYKNENYNLMNGTTSGAESINHYFGMHMSTRFVQQFGGYTDEKKTTPVTYEFSGDDDVWIFIDGKLVADLGGIHDKASVTINFATGDVIINENESVQAGHETYKLGTKMGLTSNTLLDNTYHTLDFFYLERGNVDSNMNLKYNLVTIPESSVIKVDQLGNAVPGAEFKLYAASDTGRTSPIATGTTDTSGEFIFLREDESGNQYPITIDELYNSYQNSTDGKGNNLILTETVTPEGYRSVGEIGLYFSQSANGEVLLLSNSIWDKGAYAMPKVTATTPSVIHLTAGQYTTVPQDKEYITLVGKGAVENPLMFAVVYQKQTVNGVDTWLPVSGDPLNGWKVESDNKWDNVLSAAKASPYIFQLASSGAYQVEVSNLPGDIKTYYHICGKAEDAKYTIGYYYTEADTLEGANADNTWRIDSDTTVEANKLSRVFSMDVYVSNIKNYLLVQKVDDKGDTVNGATFALYKADDVTITGGKLTVNDGKTEFDAVETTTTTDPSAVVALDGGGIFPKTVDTLPLGEYYLVETSAPSGYKINDTPIHVVVDNTGVYADAGTADDGVTVLRGTGSVIRSMVQFAADDDVDVTLNEIKAAMATGTYDNSGFDWGDADWSSENILNLKYDNGNSTLDYSPIESSGKRLLQTEEGWSKLVIRQIYSTGDTLKTDLGEQDITNLFSGTVTVRVTNDRIGNLKISKKVTGDGAPTGQEFTFTVTITDEDVKDGDSFKTKDQSGQEGTINFANGKATVELKDGESLTILGLPTGATFDVVESSVSGFTTSVQATHLGDDSEAVVDQVNSAHVTGTIGHNTTEEEATTLAYTNDFDGSAWLALTGTKTLEGRNITETDNFTFTLAADATDTNTAEAIQKKNVILPQPSTAVAGTDGNFTFGEITFKAEGTYKFKITENQPAAGTQTSIRYDTHTTEVTVTVTKDVNGILTATAAYDNGDDGAETQKATFTNRLESLTLSKTVTGSLGDRDKLFDFTITLKQGDAAVTGTFSYIGGTVSGTTGTAPAGGELEFDSEGKAKIQLKHGQSITLLGLPVDATYTITETDDQDGYTTTITTNNVPETSKTTNGTLSATQTMNIAFTNTRETTVPTGVMVDSFPWLMAAGFCLLGAAALAFSWGYRRRLGHRHEN